MNKIMIFIMIGILVAGCSTTSSDSITHIYAFGDEYTDTGNGYNLLKDLANKNESVANYVKWSDTYYWQGRASNGPLPVEVLADKVKVDLTDYAFAGALSDFHNISEALIPAQQNTGLFGQVQKYISSLNGEQADPDAIYYIHIGDVDFENTKPESDFDSRILSDKVIANIAEAISQLANVGAKQFLVVNMHDISKQPLMTDDYVAGAEAYQAWFNSTLPAEMEKLAEELGVKISIFDYAGISEQILSKATDYGLTNLQDRCLVWFETTNMTTVCTKPDEYFYWDDEHPTRRVYQIIGEAMAEQLSK